jgi:hypothetical protein
MSKFKPRPDADPIDDHPEWTEADFAKAVPFAEAFPDLAENPRAKDIQTVGASGTTAVVRPSQRRRPGPLQRLERQLGGPVNADL